MNKSIYIIIAIVILLIILYILLTLLEKKQKSKFKESQYLDKYINFLLSKTNQKFYLNKNPFELPDGMEAHICSTMNILQEYNNNLKELLKYMLLYAGLPFAGIELEIIYDNNKKQKDYSGLYIDQSNVRKKIILVTNKYYTLSTIISIFAHEISHYFLAIHNIRIPNSTKTENEILTDTCAVYLGFGNYMLEGYEEFTQNIDYNVTRTSKVGYINTIDIEYILYKLETFDKN